VPGGHAARSGCGRPASPSRPGTGSRPMVDRQSLLAWIELRHPTGLDRWRARYQLFKAKTILGGDVENRLGATADHPSGHVVADVTRESWRDVEAPGDRLHGQALVSPSWGIQLPRQCIGPGSGQQALQDIPLHDFHGHRTDLCNMNLGFTLDESIPPSNDRADTDRAHRSDLPGMLRAGVPKLFQSTWSMDRTLHTLFPLFSRALARQPFRGRALVRTESRTRPMEGLFFEGDLAVGCAVLARNLLWALPFCWTPEPALELCALDGRPSNALAALNRHDLFLGAESQGALRADQLTVTVAGNGRLQVKSGGRIRGKYLARWHRDERITIAQIVDTDAFIADYHFYWAARLLAYAEQQQSQLPSPNNTWHPLDARTTEVQLFVDWLRLMADLSGRYAMAHVTRIASLIGHEILHSGTVNHCRRHQNLLGCCHHQISAGIMASLSGALGLPAPMSNYFLPSREAAWDGEPTSESLLSPNLFPAVMLHDDDTSELTLDLGHLTGATNVRRNQLQEGEGGPYEQPFAAPVTQPTRQPCGEARRTTEVRCVAHRLRGIRPYQSVRYVIERVGPYNEGHDAFDASTNPTRCGPDRRFQYRTSIPTSYLALLAD